MQNLYRGNGIAIRVIGMRLQRKARKRQIGWVNLSAHLKQPPIVCLSHISEKVYYLKKRLRLSRRVPHQREPVAQDVAKPVAQRLLITLKTLKITDRQIFFEIRIPKA